MLGLGDMGRALAGAFLDAGRRTVVWNRTSARADAPVARGADRAADAGEAVRAARLVVVCLLDPAAVREVLEPLAEELRGRTVVDLTNGSPAQAAEPAGHHLSGRRDHGRTERRDQSLARLRALSAEGHGTWSAPLAVRQLRTGGRAG